MISRLPHILPGFFLLFAVGCSTSSPGVRPATPVATPLEEKHFAELTSHAELLAFVAKLGEESDRVSVHRLGESAEGRTIPYLKISRDTFGENREEKLLLLIFAQQHGNEPSGKEGALALARDLAAGRHDDKLQYLDILLVPQVNPDGGERHQRRNAENVDLNRSHLILDGKEVRYLRELFFRWQPEVTLDVHEYQPWTNSWLEHGFIRLFDEQYGVPTNLNVPAPIRELAEQGFLPFAAQYLEERDFTFHNYTVGSPDSIRYSTSNINDGRQGFAILNTFGLILEGRNGRTRTDEIERRTAAQTAAMEALLEFCADRREEIRRTVHDARRAIRNGEVERVTLTMLRASSGSPLEIPVRSVEPSPDGHPDRYVKAGITRVTLDNYFPLVVAERETDLPHAYLVPAGERELIDLLRQHQVNMNELAAGEQLEAEVFVIEDFVEAEYESRTRIPVGSTQIVRYTAAEGDVLIPTAQLQGLMLATALEPQSMHGLIQYDAFSHLQAPGAYPVKRIPGPVD